MGHLKSKSEINLCAAELLHKQCFYPPVVHCAYYSCFQLMKHIWLYSIGNSENELKALNKNSKEGSHEVLINQIKLFVKDKSRNDRDFNNEILQLKRLRVRADYDDNSIDSDKSSNSINLSKSIQIKLKQCI